MISPAVHNLIQAYFEGDGSPEVIEAIEAWLKEDPSNLRLFAEYGCIEDMLYVEQDSIDSDSIYSIIAESEAGTGPDFLDAPIFKSSLDQQGQADAISSRQLAMLSGYLVRQALTSKLAYKAYAVAAVMLLAVTLLSVFTSDDDVTPTGPMAEQEPSVEVPVAPYRHTATNPVATLTNEVKAVWDRRPDRVFSAGERFTLTQGFAEITTQRGAVVILEAPATIAFLDNDNAIWLDEGRLVGLCHTESSKGFVVKTKHTEITDLGTEFGVQVNENRVEVSVFSGEVQIQSPGLKPRLLKAKQSAEVTTEADSRELVVGELVTEDWNRFARRLPRTSALAEVRLLGLEGFEANVLPQGFWDGSKPYTHRWSSLNGIDDSDIPIALRGGDLVQMPGDVRSKVTPAGVNLRVQLEPVQRVDVYLLLSERQKPTDWLLRDYEQTPWEVGVALSANRIDTYSIWKRKFPVAETTIVGQDVENSMYLLLLVPREPTEANQP